MKTSSCDVNAILTTRIPQINTRDRLSWVHASDGQYYVKTGYTYWHSQHIGDAGGVQQSPRGGKIWNLNIPHKIKVFLWRFCRNNVPIRNMLRCKGVVTPIVCSMCDRDVKHLLHIFFDCDYAKQCWQIVGLTFDMWEVESAPVWLLEKLSTETHENIVKIATVLWSIWFARDKRIWDNVALTPVITISLSSNQVTEWREVWKRKHKNTMRPVQETTQTGPKWEPPIAGKLKINVDASVYEGEN